MMGYMGAEILLLKSNLDPRITFIIFRPVRKRHESRISNSHLLVSSAKICFEKKTQQTK